MKRNEMEWRRDVCFARRNKYRKRGELYLEQKEFHVSTDLRPISGMTIEANFTETEHALAEMMAPYQSMVVTQDTIQAAKADRAKIRAVGKRIDDYRIEVKRLWMAPVEEFERKCKALSSICGNAAGNLDVQIKGFDDDRRRSKLDDLRRFYEENAGELGEYRKFEDIASPKWGNATFSLADAEKEILDMAARFNLEIAVVRGMNSPYEASLIETYLEKGTLAEVMRKNAQLLERDRRERERRDSEAAKAARAAEEARRQAERKAADPVPPGIQPAQPGCMAETPKDVLEEEEIIELVFRVHVTRSQMEGLKAYLRQAGIRPERV